jgi:hypothetical protein
MDESQLIDLDECVVNALNLFIEQEPPKISFEFKRPMVVGSGNAAATGRIIFEKTDAVFADESNFELKLKHIGDIDGVVLISASGGKHAPIIAKRAKELGKRIILLTNNQQALAKDFADETYVFPKNPEPYTYNTSTYMGFILATTGEEPKGILSFIQSNIDPMDMPDFGKYQGYFLIVPENFEGLVRMLQVKFIELFGRRIARDVETFEYMKHAVTVVPSNELFISFGRENKTFGENRFFVSLPENADYGAVMAIAYYIIGKIQKSYPPWFKQNLERYTGFVSRVFDQEIKPIVE